MRRYGSTHRARPILPTPDVGPTRRPGGTGPVASTTAINKMTDTHHASKLGAPRHSCSGRLTDFFSSSDLGPRLRHTRPFTADLGVNRNARVPQNTGQRTAKCGTQVLVEWSENSDTRYLYYVRMVHCTTRQDSTRQEAHTSRHKGTANW